MMHTCRNMDSLYPFQRNQAPFPHHYYPGIEANHHPQMKIDPHKHPFPYEQPLPYGGGSYNFCCGHNNNFPGYYSHMPCCYHHHNHHAPIPSPTMYYSGGYHHHGEPFFVPYSPQPHHTMELPRYEYDKYNMPRDYHCCGCPNHPGHRNEGKGVKIEEEEPDGGRKVNGDALAPIQPRNNPYPVVWIPPEYTSNKEVKDHPAAEPPSPRYFRDDEKEPRVRNGWLPFDMKGAPNMVVHEGDKRRNRNFESENTTRESESEDGGVNHKKRPEFPFPIIWMPYYNKQEEGGMENNNERIYSPKRIEEAPHSFKPVPVNPKADEGVTNGIRPSQVESTNTSGSDAAKKVTSEKIIPVKEMESHQGKNDSEGGDKREKIIPVNQMEEEAATKKDSHSHTSVEKQSASPRKTSKLPPVCLRVDPLPKKKNGNRSSRSPSPPASKGNSQATNGGTSKTPSGGMTDKVQSNSNAQNAHNTGEKVKPKERTIQVSEEKTNGSSPALEEHSQEKSGETSKTPSVSLNDKAQPDSSPHKDPNISEKVKPKERTIQVNENMTNENKGADSKDECHMPSGVSMETKESCSVGDKEENKAEKGAEVMKEEATELREMKDSSKPTDESRKEEKVLSEVDAAVLIQAAYRGHQVRRWEPLKKLKQIAEVSKELADVRSHIQAFEQSSELQNDEKQRIAIGETIMRLLLKLDTIQGLHSSFREMRKSLARELTSLQERLDSIVAKKPQQQMNEFVDTKPVEDIPMNTQNEEKAAVAREDSSEGISHDMQGESETQSCLKDGINSLAADDGGNAAQSPIAPSNATVDESNCTMELPETDNTVVELEVKSEADNIPIEVDNLDVNAWNELPVGVIDDDITGHISKKDEQNEKGREEDQLIGLAQAMVHDSECNGEDSDVIPMTELPVGLIDEDIATSEFDKDDGAKVCNGGVQDEDVESIVELPVWLFDENTEKSESAKHDETETCNLILQSEEGKYSADEKTSSSIDDTAKDTQLEQQEEVQSSEESGSWVKIELQNEDGIEGSALPDIEFKSGEETGNGAAEFPSLTAQANAEECMVANDVKTNQPEPMESVTGNVEHVLINDSHREEEHVAKQETQVEKQAISAGNEDTQTLAKEKTELSALSSPAASEVIDDVAEHDGGLSGDSNLLEENDKLREMMQKLLEAGNEQLNVISDLTGRVKDLEKRLARSKRVKTKRLRPAKSKINPNNLLQNRAIGVAM